MNHSNIKPLGSNDDSFKILRKSKFSVSDRVMGHISNRKSKIKLVILATPQDYENLGEEDRRAFELNSEGKKVICSWISGSKRCVGYFYDEEIEYQD